MPIDAPFEYLSFGTTFNRTFGIFADHFDFFSFIAIFSVIPYIILQVSLGVLVGLYILEESGEVPDFHISHIPMIILVMGLQLVVYSAGTIFGKAAITLGVARMYVGQRISFVECLKDAWAMKWPLLSVTFLMGLGFMAAALLVALVVAIAVASASFLGGFLAFVIIVGAGFAVLYGYIGVCLVTSSVMVEQIKAPVRALNRSWELAAGSRTYITFTLFCLWFMNNLLARLLQSLFFGADPMEVFFSVVGLVVIGVPQFLFFPLHAILETVMYLNLRVGRESMNHQVLASELMREAGGETHSTGDQPSSAFANPSVDYRHVPLVDAEEYQAPTDIL